MEQSGITVPLPNANALWFKRVTKSKSCSIRAQNPVAKCGPPPPCVAMPVVPALFALRQDWFRTLWPKNAN